MRVTVGADGEVSFDTDDVKQAVDMVRALRNGTGTAPKSDKPKRTHKKRRTKPVEMETLSKELTETWNWLVAHNDPNGVHVETIAAGLGIAVHSVTYRVNKLIAKGLAHRVKRGRYRPGEAPEPAAEEASEPASAEVPESPE